MFLHSSFRNFIIGMLLPCLLTMGIPSIALASQYENREPGENATSDTGQEVYFQTDEQITTIVIVGNEQINPQVLLATINEVIYLNGGIPPTQILYQPLDSTDILSGSIAGLRRDNDTPPPKGPGGDPLPPPVKLPPGANGDPNKWVAIPGNNPNPDGRPVKWVPQYPVENDGKGQPQASWDPKDGGHWDVDNGRGTRTRVRPDGTTLDGNHQPDDTITWPPPFLGLNHATIHLYWLGVVLFGTLVFGAGVVWWLSGEALS